MSLRLLCALENSAVTVTTTTQHVIPVSLATKLEPWEPGNRAVFCSDIFRNNNEIFGLKCHGKLTSGRSGV